MNYYRPPAKLVETDLSPDGLVTIPEAIRRATGLLPGCPVVVGANERGEVVVMTRMRAKRLGETIDARRERLEAALNDAGSGRYSTGQTTAEVMGELRGQPT